MLACILGTRSHFTSTFLSLIQDPEEKGFTLILTVTVSQADTVLLSKDRCV